MGLRKKREVYFLSCTHNAGKQIKPSLLSKVTEVMEDMIAVMNNIVGEAIELCVWGSALKAAEISVTVLFLDQVIFGE